MLEVAGVGSAQRRRPFAVSQARLAGIGPFRRHRLFIRGRSRVSSFPPWREPSHTFCSHPSLRTRPRPAVLTPAENSDPAAGRGGERSSWLVPIPYVGSELLHRTTQKVPVLPGRFYMRQPPSQGSNAANKFSLLLVGGQFCSRAG